jgi:hypothetical protein
VYQAVASVDWPAAAPALKDATPAAVLQTLLTYCYAAGLYSSRDIEYAARTDPAVKYICANFRPGSDTIRHFRRRHLLLIQTAVARMLALNSFDGDAEAEAERCLTRAVREDSMALDD